MSAGWQVGDLALCVDGSPCGCGCGPVPQVKGHIYRVVGILRLHDRNGLPILALDGLPLEPGIHAAGYNSARFRKILPDAHEKCEPEFVTLLNRIKHPVSPTVKA